MELSIIIVNYQSEEYLKKCLLSLRNKIKDFEPEIIVVNNDDKKINIMSFRAPDASRGVEKSRDPSASSDMLSDCAQDDIKIINSGENLGFGKANNLAAKNASGEILWFLNPDTKIIPENIKELLNKFSSNPKVGIIGPKLITESGNIQGWIAGYETNLWNLIRNNLGFPKSKKIWESEEKKEADWVTGAAMFIKKDLFQKLGGFDEKFFMYFEDEDLCKRARQTGYKVIYCPNFIVRHLGGKSFENKKEQKKYYYASQDYYFQKHFGKFTAFWVKVLRKATSPFRKRG